MAEEKSGLQKEVSSIFNSVQSEQDGQKNMESEANGQHEGKISSETLVPSHLRPDEAEQHQEPDEAKPRGQQPKRENKESSKDKVKKAEAVQSHKKKVTKNSGLEKMVKKISDKLLAPRPGVNPAKQKAMLVLIPILSVVLIVVFTQVLKTPSRGSNRTVKTNAGMSFLDESTQIDWRRPEVYPSTLRNPMKIVTSGTEQQTGELILKGILYSRENPSALFSNQIVNEGDKISGVTIVKINEDSVELEKDGKKWTQRVQK